MKIKIINRLKNLWFKNKSSNVIEYKVIINSWRHSNEGDYIEYQIELSDFKGLETRTIYKRYSDFVFLHELIEKNVKEPIPQLPPRNIERTEETLNLRMKQLEEYLNWYFVKHPINPIILEFFEVIDSGSPIFHELSRQVIIIKHFVECILLKLKILVFDIIYQKIAFD